MAAEPPEARDSPDDVVGQPDVRFSYENERTFRAWIRRVIGLPLIALGVVIAIASLINWRANEHAMKAGLPLPRSPLPAIAAVVVSVVAVVGLVLGLFAGSSK